MHESAYTARINTKCKPFLKRVWKIKADMQSGIPDCYYLGDENALWIEYKLIKELPKRSNTLIVPGLSELQKGWLQDQFDVMGNARVIVGVERIDGLRGCGNIIFYDPDEWLNGMTRWQAEIRLRTYHETVNHIVDYCNK